VSILERLNYYNGRVLELDVSVDKKTVNLMEQCDQYFSVDLTKEEFGKLIKELNQIYDSME